MMAIDIHAAIEQELHNLTSPVPGGIPQGHFAPGTVRRIGELLHDVEPPDSRRADQAHTAPVVGEVFGGLRAAVGETGVHRVGAFAGQIGVLDLGAVLEQHVHHRDLDSGFLGRCARGHEPQRGTAAAVDIGLGFDVRAGVQENLRDARGVRRRFLTVALDAVG